MHYRVGVKEIVSQLYEFWRVLVAGNLGVVLFPSPDDTSKQP